jgi:hypothetical protein
VRLKIEKTDDNLLNIQLVNRFKNSKKRSDLNELYIDQKSLKGETTTDQQKMLELCRSFYSELYNENTKSNINREKAQEEFLSKKLFTKKISPEEAELLEKRIADIEIALAVSKCENGRSCGSSGFPIEFYKVFWKKIGQIVCDAIKFSSEHEMSRDQKLAILRLIPKGEKDTKAIKFQRPISLLNTQYKIYAKGYDGAQKKKILTKIGKVAESASNSLWNWSHSKKWGGHK